MSAHLKFKKKEYNLEQALKYISNNGILNPAAIDKQLISSVNSNWPLHIAVPILVTESIVHVIYIETFDSAKLSELKKFVPRYELSLIPIKAESWQEIILKQFKLANGTNNSSSTTRQSDPVKPKVEKPNQLGAELLKTLDQIPAKRINSIDDNSIASEIKSLIAQSAKAGASDIHFEPVENALLVRFRIDGVLSDICKYVLTVDADYRKILLARIKIIANLNIAESRIPQDGRVTENINGKRIDLRVSTLPCLHGEKCVIRLLPHENKFHELESLGMPTSIIPTFESWLKMSQGMILITGPTGSGKTSTLYTSLAKVVDVSKNVVTVEDPVEFQLARVNQVQVNVKAGLTFAAGLRSILRQDPDIIMIGEIRDKETAEIAVQSSLTGHLVLSTIHTNDAPSTVNRLIDMGVEPYLVASALVGVVAQRLMRAVCPHCAEKYTASPSELAYLDLSKDENITLSRAKGCQKCNNTGYSGREGIFEIMPVTSKIKQLIHKQADVEDIRQIMREIGAKTLFQIAVDRVVDNKTTLEELMRVVPKD